MVRPVKEPHRVTSGYGPRVLNGVNQFHDGIDYIHKYGDNTVLAMDPGVVTYDQDNYDDSKRWTDPKHSAGNMLIIKHDINGENFYIRYLHLQNNYVAVGDVVEEGQEIGQYSDVGYSFGAHLHIDMYTMGWRKINPTQIILSNLREN